MNRHLNLLLAALGTALALNLNLNPVALAGDSLPATPRIGVFDSRAVAVAFAGSPTHQQLIQALRDRHEAAQKSGDQELVAKLQAEGKAGQKRLHEQGFSTAPVDDLLAHIERLLPEIKKTAGVSDLVSKWDKTALDRHAGAERVDVTLRLVDAFDPKPRQRERAIEIQKRPPLPIEKVRAMHD